MHRVAIKFNELMQFYIQDRTPCLLLILSSCNSCVGIGNWFKVITSFSNYFLSNVASTNVELIAFNHAQALNLHHVLLLFHLPLGFTMCCVKYHISRRADTLAH